MKNIIKPAALLGMLSISLFACSDWNDVESVNIKQPDIADQNPALYEAYLKDLRQYKNSDHKDIYVWFDNSEKIPFNRSQHITDLPDSIDVISMIHPDNLQQWEIDEINNIRDKKGTKVIYTIDFDAIKADYNTLLEQATDEEPVAEEFKEYLTSSLQSLLHISHRFPYDGVCVAYKGKALIHMTDKELEEYKMNEKIFMGIMADWQKRNSEKMINFSGRPQNLIDKTFLDNCRLILLSDGINATNQYLFSYHLALAATDGVPADRLAMMTTSTSLDPEDTKTGYFTNGMRSLQACAEWCASVQNSGDVAGIGIYNVSTDYFNPAQNYLYTRYAISIINPSIK